MTQSFSYTGQIVTWTVPTGVTSLTIEARGAEGGDVVNRRATAGKGAIVVARVSVTPGQALSVLVGQSLNGRSAGGGGSFVAAPGSAGAPTALVVAGGGGGASTINGNSEAKHGQPGTSGGTGGFAFSGNNNNPGTGGTNTNGGGSGANGAGGGGGFTGNGGGTTTYPNVGGRSFTNGGAGGSGAAAGSYGGGGSSDEGVTSGGGGGGYSGGGAGYTGVGGGGGSYYPSGTSLSVVSGITGNSGNGLVTISYTTYPIRYVKATASGSGDGSSWANASSDLQAMIDASGVEQVWVAGGRYTRTSGGNSFAMKNGVAIYGGFAGTETSLAARPAVNPVGGQLSSTTLTVGSGGGRAIDNNGLTATARLDGVVITGGRDTFGGGIYNGSSSPSFTNCAITDNTAPNGDGGGIFNSSSSPSFTNCAITNNTAPSGVGGGIFNDGSSPSFTNCLLVSNSANLGGAMRNDNSSPRLTNCTLTANRATFGAALINYSSSQPQLINCILWNNQESNGTSINNDNGTGVTASYCLIGDGENDFTGANNLVATVSPFVSTTDFQLNQCSVAINAGDPNSTTSGSTDLAGNPRFFQSGRIDIGAYEYQGTPAQPVAITQQPTSSSSVTVGANVSVPVTVSGSVSTYQWYKDNLSNAVNGQTSATLTLSNVQLSDAGSYSLVITGSCNSLTSNAFNLSVSPAVTGAPSLNSPASGTTTNGLPTFAGSAPASSSVRVIISGTTSLTLTATATSGGTFSVSPGSPLASGSYAAYAVAMTSGQTSSAPSNTNGFTVDATPPGVTLSASVGNGTTTMNQPTSFTARFSEAVTGFGPGGISVSNGSVSSFAGNGTTYSFNVSANAAGQVSVSIPANVAADGVGNSNTASASYSYTFQAPTITLSPPPGNLPGGTQGIAYSVTFSASGGSGTYTYALSGTPPPGMTLTDARLSGTPTASGIFRFRITATDNAAAPGPYSGSGEYTINIAPQPMTGMPSLSSPASGAVTNNNRPTYSGTAPANSTVTVFVNNASVGTTTATGAGSFSLQQPAALADGAYQVYVTAQLSGQSPSNSTNVNSFTVDTTVPSLTLSSAQVSNGGTTASSPVSFTAQFSEPVTGFSTSGISVSNGTVSNLQAQPGGTSYSFQVTASSAGPVSVAVNANAAQDAATNGNTASDSYGFTLTPGDFAIRSVDTRQCQLVDASRGEYRVSFTPVYSGLNGTPVSLRVINEVDATTAPGPYTIRLYSDNPTVTLLAQQAASSDARFSYAWLAACQGSVAPNRPPTTTGIPAQQLVQNQPYQLELTRYFADPDGQTLTYSSSALPAGLTLAGTTISGSPTAPGRTTVRITAIDPGGLSVATDVAMQVDAPPATTPPAGFTITSVTDLTCVAVTATERRVSFSPVYSGLDGSSVRFQVVNEQDFGTTPGPYTLRLYTDNPAVTLEAVQAGQTATYRYDWLSACGSQTPPTVTNRPPEVVVPIAPQSATAGQGYSFYVPANTFVDPEGERLSLRTGALPAGLRFSASLSAIIGTPAQAGTSTIQLTASDPAGQSVSLSFTLQVVAGAATPPTPPAGFTITGVGSVTCLSVSSTERRLSFFPQYTGVDGSPIRFRVINEQDFGTAPGPYSLRLYTDNPAITLTATQGGSSASYRYNWLAACASPANGRQAVAEADSPLSVVVLGNPVIDGQLRLELRGVAGQPADLRLVSTAGQLLSQTFIESVVEGEPQTLGIRANWGTILLLQVRSGGQQQTIKVIQTR